MGRNNILIPSSGNLNQSTTIGGLLGVLGERIKTEQLKIKCVPQWRKTFLISSLPNNPTTVSPCLTSRDPRAIKYSTSKLSPWWMIRSPGATCEIQKFRATARLTPVVASRKAGLFSRIILLRWTQMSAWRSLGQYFKTCSWIRKNQVPSFWILKMTNMGIGLFEDHAWGWEGAKWEKRFCHPPPAFPTSPPENNARVRMQQELWTLLRRRSTNTSRWREALQSITLCYRIEPERCRRTIKRWFQKNKTSSFKQECLWVAVTNVRVIPVLMVYESGHVCPPSGDFLINRLQVLTIYNYKVINFLRVYI